ncbi:MAG: hypothetical protein ABJA94_06240 [Rhodoglobus sp.]
MTITAPRPGNATKPARTASTTEWTAVQSGLWVGKVDGEFAGMIEARWGEGFIATTRLAQTLGVFLTVEEAQASFSKG